MLRTIWGDDDRYVDTYWSRFGKNVYFAGDGAKKDADGNIWLLGRVDDVMNVSGPPHLDHRGRVLAGRPPGGRRGGGRGRQRPDHRPGHRGVRDPARERRRTPATSWCRRCATTSARDIGPIAKPRQIMVVQELPKTRSGKIMRRLLRDIAENRELGDVTTLTDSSVMNLIKEKLPAAPSED